MIRCKDNDGMDGFPSYLYIFYFYTEEVNYITLYFKSEEHMSASPDNDTVLSITKEEVPMGAYKIDDPRFMIRPDDFDVMKLIMQDIHTLSTIDQFSMLMALALTVHAKKDVISQTTRIYELTSLVKVRSMLREIYESQIQLQQKDLPPLVSKNVEITKIFNTLPSLTLQELVYVHMMTSVAVEAHPKCDSNIGKLYKSFGTKLYGMFKNFMGKIV